MRYRKKAVRTAVVAVVQNPEGSVLLTKRAIPPYMGKWVMPGGKIDLGGEPGMGARISLYFPLAPTQDVSPDEDREEA